MNPVIKTRIIRIGNSQGVRIPKYLLDQLAFGEEVELELQDDALLLRPLRPARAGWEEQFRLMAEQKDDYLLDEPHAATEWDETEWEW
jgi:antitoxin MazE